MKTSLDHKFEQQAALTPQLQQAIRLLQLSSQELELEIQALLEKNPFLEYEQSSDLVEQSADVTELDISVDKNNEREHSDFESDDYFPQNLSIHLDNQRNNIPSNDSESHLHCKQTPSLQEHLRWQSDLTPFSEADMLIAIILIDSVSEEGYLSCSLPEIQDTLLTNHGLYFELPEIEVVLHRIQQFEPLGVGARNLSECLRIQLNALPHDTAFLVEAKQLITHHLELLGTRDFSRLKHLLNLDTHDLKVIIKLLMQLDPKPGLQFIAHKKIECIIPDLIVRKKNGRFVVKHNRDTLPKLKINANTTAAFKNIGKTSKGITLKAHYNEAQWFLKSLHHRQSTLLEVARNIIELQTPFLERGEEHMKGLALHEIATKTNLHESTVSRVTTQKYIDTPRGIFELKYFFSSTVHADSGKLYSSTAIRAHIKKMIMKEIPNKPLSDQNIASMLAQIGIKITRRTVTKYRETLQIPASNERKNLLCKLNEE